MYIELHVRIKHTHRSGYRLTILTRSTYINYIQLLTNLTM